MVKAGFSDGRQRYKCKDCNKRFIPHKSLDGYKLYDAYLNGKQTLEQLSFQNKVSVRTIQRKLEKVEAVDLPAFGKSVVILMDTSYWGRDFGVVAFKDVYSKLVIWHKFIYRKERLADYFEGIEQVGRMGYAIQGVVCDGMPGLIKALSHLRVQYCQFHMVKTVRSKLTKSPKSDAGRDLLQVACLIAHTDKESFVGYLAIWYDTYEAYLNERSEPDSNGHTHYMHKRLRSAYLGIKRNMEYLWTWYDNIDLRIPNTNNGIEALFTDLKSKLRVHNGLSLKNREKFISQYFRTAH